MATGTSSVTRTATATSTLTKVVYVTRKVQADFLSILDTYGYFSEAYAQQLIHDVRVLLDEEVIEHVHFVWTRGGSNFVLDEYRYSVVTGGIGLADDRPGGISYRSELASADFAVRVTYNRRWKEMDDVDRLGITSDLQLRWSAAGVLDYSGGSWVNDRTYSREDLALPRKRFVR